MILIDEKNAAGQAIRLEGAATQNGRGRVVEQHLTLTVDGETVWEGSDTPENAPTWQAVLAEARNVPAPSSKKKGK